MTTAETFATVVVQAMTLDPHGLTESLLIVHDRLPGSATGSESGIRAARVETCQDQTCPQSDGWDHTHPVPTDPTGDAALRPSESDRDLDAIEHHVGRFVANVAELHARSVSNGPPTTWSQAVQSAGLLVSMGAVDTLETTWGTKAVKRWVTAAGDAIHDLQLIADGHASREPSQDEKHWSAGLADEDCCVWHLAIHSRIRRPRSPGKNICPDCCSLAELLGQKPPPWLIEAEIDRAGRPKAWTAALSRCMEELGVRAEVPLSRPRVM